MATYVPDLDMLQVGKEVTWGTAVACTAKMGLIESVEVDPGVEGTTLPDVRASLGGGYVQTLDKQFPTWKVSGTATYEDLCYWLESLNAVITPSGANPYVRAGEIPLTAVPAHRMMTMNWGQTGAVKKLAGCIANDLTIKIEANQPWKFDVSGIAKSVVDGTIAVLTDRTQTPIHANNTALKIDAWGGTIGTTTITSTWFSAELNIKNNSVQVPGIGSLTPATYADAAYSGSLKLSLETDATTAAYINSIIGSSLLQQQVRIIGTTGASGIAQLDFCGGHLKAPTVHNDQDGVVTYEFELERVYHATVANWFKNSITNIVATLP
jgi:hypothetical protein